MKSFEDVTFESLWRQQIHSKACWLSSQVYEVYSSLRMIAMWVFNAIIMCRTRMLKTVDKQHTYQK